MSDLTPYSSTLRYQFITMVGITSHLIGQSRRALHRLSKTYSLNREDARRQALFRLGERYLFGKDGEAKDAAKALVYFRQAAQRGYLLAQTVLGFCYEFGIGADTDLKEAERLYIECAAQNEGFAQARLAFLRKYGRPGIRIDRVEADEWQAKVSKIGPSSISWLMEAAEVENEASAQYCLGVCYHDGVAVEKNETLAVYCTGFYDFMFDQRSLCLS